MLDNQMLQPSIDLPSGVAAHYTDIRALPDGRLIGTLQLLFHWTLHVDIDWFGYADRYCFQSYDLVRAAFDGWDGTGDPVGWHRHPKSGRRRDLGTGREWISP